MSNYWPWKTFDDMNAEDIKYRLSKLDVWETKMTVELAELAPATDLITNQLTSLQSRIKILEDKSDKLMDQLNDAKTETEETPIIRQLKILDSQQIQLDDELKAINSKPYYKFRVEHLRNMLAALTIERNQLLGLLF